MFKSKLLVAIALSAALLPLNSIAMEGQPDVVFEPGRAQQPAAQDDPAQAQPGIAQPARQLAPAAAAPAPAAAAPAPAPAAARLSSWSRLGRQLIKPIAFLLGAAALGGITYAGNQRLPVDKRGAWVTLGAIIGGLTGMSYTKKTVDDSYVPPVVHQGSLAASIGFAGTVAALGMATYKASNGNFVGETLSYLAGMIVGSAMYYTK